MSGTATARLLADLRRRGVRLAIRGDRLRVNAPESVASPELRTRLTEHKPEILDRLRQEQRLLTLSLDDFERQSDSIECLVPWLRETLWFVPRLEHVDTLVREGVARGRIWTTWELRNLSALPGLTREEVTGIAKLRIAFNAEIVSVESAKDGAAVVEGATNSRCCPVCGSASFWRSTLGVVTCSVCHPPTSERLVAAWIDAAARPNGAGDEAVDGET